MTGILPTSDTDLFGFDTISKDEEVFRGVTSACVVPARRNTMVATVGFVASRSLEVFDPLSPKTEARPIGSLVRPGNLLTVTRFSGLRGELSSACSTAVMEDRRVSRRGLVDVRVLVLSLACLAAAVAARYSAAWKSESPSSSSSELDDPGYPVAILSLALSEDGRRTEGEGDCCCGLLKSFIFLYKMLFFFGDGLHS
tara:strand:- start:103 stop:696 length:594 start_codon:yes stop_codon:yes gene_type:complete